MNSLLLKVVFFSLVIFLSGCTMEEILCDLFGKCDDPVLCDNGEFQIKGNISGIDISHYPSVILVNQSTNKVHTIDKNGEFVFGSNGQGGACFASGYRYDFSIYQYGGGYSNQPYLCEISNGYGEIESIHMSDIEISCEKNTDYIPPPSSSPSPSLDPAVYGISEKDIPDTFSSPSPLSRDGVQTPPNIIENDYLQIIEAPILDHNATINQFWHISAIESLLRKANLEPNLPFTVEEDFAVFERPFFGAMAGHSVVIFDGKFFDILKEFSTYLVLREHSLTPEPWTVAINLIVNSHSPIKGYIGDQHFMYDSLSTNLQLEAIQKYQELAAVIVYHEFAHIYLYHQLDKVRGSSPPYDNGLFILYTSIIEDQADYAAGALLKRAGFSSTEIPKQVYDILTFFIVHRVFYDTPREIFSIEEMTDDIVNLIDSKNYSYSTATVRKALLDCGFNGIFPLSNSC